jgi:hypothetical protein
MIHVGARSYKIARHKTIAGRLGPRVGLSELRMGSEVRADTDEADPDAPLVLHDSAALIAQPTLSFSEMTRLLLIRSYHWKPPLTYQPP